MGELLWTLSYYSDYAHIALENYTPIKQLVAKRNGFEKKYDSRQISEEEDREWTDIINTIDKYSRIVIIFCALSLEAFINDYAIDRTSKSYLENYLDKLDLHSKWVVIPRLLTGHQLDTGSQPMEDLDWLIKQRNKLVHFKSVTVEVSKMSEKLDLYAYDEQKAQEAIDTVRNIVLALHGIDKKANETWLYYENEWFPSKRLNSP